MRESSLRTDSFARSLAALQSQRITVYNINGEQVGIAKAHAKTTRDLCFTGDTTVKEVLDKGGALACLHQLQNGTMVNWYRLLPDFFPNVMVDGQGSLCHPGEYLGYLSTPLTILESQPHNAPRHNTEDTTAARESPTIRGAVKPFLWELLLPGSTGGISTIWKRPYVPRPDELYCELARQLQLRKASTQPCLACRTLIPVQLLLAGGPQERGWFCPVCVPQTWEASITGNGLPWGSGPANTEHHSFLFYQLKLTAASMQGRCITTEEHQAMQLADALERDSQLTMCRCCTSMWPQDMMCNGYPLLFHVVCPSCNDVLVIPARLQLRQMPTRANEQNPTECNSGSY